MAAALPKPLRETVDQLARLPGVGPVSALRMAMRLLAWPRAEAEALGRSILALRQELCLCSRCGGIADADPCPICADSTRENDTLCIVRDWDSVLALENGGFYRGLYFVLGGLLAPQRKGEMPGIDLEPLVTRLGEDGIKEVVLALGSTVEAENTATLIKNLIARDFPAARVTRLAQGMPLGAEVKYMDYETLRQSMRNRQAF